MILYNIVVIVIFIMLLNLNKIRSFGIGDVVFGVLLMSWNREVIILVSVLLMKFVV